MTHVRRPNRRPVSPEVARLIDGETCPTTGKVSYPDEYAAALVLRQQRHNDPRGDALESYRCADHYHLGHGR